MKNQNTIELLKECDAGTKMAVASIDEVLDFVHDDNLKNLLTESKEHHETLGNELHSLLSEYNSSDKEPNPIAKGMSWMKANMKLSMDCGPHDRGLQYGCQISLQIPKPVRGCRQKSLRHLRPPD